MGEKKFYPRNIYVEKGCLSFPLTKRILKNAPNIPTEIINDSRVFIERRKRTKNALEEGKKDLLISRQKGEFIKPCPCTPQYLGCNYFIINLDLNCPLDCSYCILQHYLTNPLLTVYANLDELWEQLDVFLHKHRKRIIRIGTGELGDSLVLDHLTENSFDLISYFRNKSNTIFELKTKAVNTENLLKVEPPQNVVISWSVNSSKVARSEEKGAPSVMERIAAARRISEHGFWIGFHFDPIIRHPGYEDDYEKVIDAMLGYVDASRIAWISLGSLRFPPGLKGIIKRRFPETKIIYDELITGRDGKFRYFRPIRLDLYKMIVSFIKKKGGEKIPLYFCMESEQIWREVMGWIPRGEESLEAYLSFPLGRSKTKFTLL